LRREKAFNAGATAEPARIHNDSGFLRMWSRLLQPGTVRAVTS
jgi:hypothetical protein